MIFFPAQPALMPCKGNRSSSFFSMEEVRLSIASTEFLVKLELLIRKGRYKQTHIVCEKKHKMLAYLYMVPAIPC